MTNLLTSLKDKPAQSEAAPAAPQLVQLPTAESIPSPRRTSEGFAVAGLDPLTGERVPKPPVADMHPTALVFLDDPIARRLAVAWETCGGNEDNWIDAAGLTMAQRADGLRLCRALRLNGICRDDGTTAKLALQYISAIVAEPLNRSTRRGKKG